jgi:hypothetical protein
VLSRVRRGSCILCSCTESGIDTPCLYYDGEHVCSGIMRGFEREITMRYAEMHGEHGCKSEGNADNGCSSHIILGVYLIIFGLGKSSWYITTRRTLIMFQALLFSVRNPFCVYALPSTYPNKPARVPDPPTGGSLCFLHVFVSRPWYL